ncbi:MAG TPA: hypothetical protein VM074_12035 [Solimonas sp.]|nr:hypothetical protein [Solimonas sp.]
MPDQFCAGAAKRAVSPTQQHIDGIEEPRLAVGTRTQKFNLGGFGVNTTGNFPNPFGTVGEMLTQPAQERVYTNRFGQDENLHVRVLVLEGPDDTGAAHRVAFVTVDAIGAGNLIQDRVMAAVNEASCAMQACIELPDVIFGQTHTHAGPDLQGLWGGVPQDWIENSLIAGIREAAAEALHNRARARLSVAQGEAPEFNNYRRPRVDPNARTDETLSLLRVAPAAGGPMIASLVQYNAHPTTVDEDPRIAHADFILGAVESLEAEGGVGLYYNGLIADASGSGGDCTDIAEPNAYERVRCRGAAIVAKARSFVPQARELAPTLAVRHVTASLPVTNPAFAAAGVGGSFNRYYNFTPQELRDIPVLGGLLDTVVTELGQVTLTAETYVTRLTLGGTQGLEIVTIPGEATGTYGRYIKSLADPAAKVILLGLTHNSFGYIIPEEEFSYVDPSGDAGFVAPFTGYEEFVSMGPLTAPLLRLQAYQPLFDADPSALPAYLADCVQPTGQGCLITRIAQNVDYIQRAYARTCAESGGPAEFCSMLDPQTPLAQPCRDAGLPEGVCSAFTGAPTPVGDADLVLPALDALLRGCDILDSAACLLPFPSNHFTTAAADGSPQSVERGGTGLHLNFNLLAMPRNAFGKPIDPTEWNRQDGFSPGQMIVTYVPRLGTLKDTNGLPYGPVTGAVPLGDLSQFDAPDAAVQVLEVPDNLLEAPQRQLVWAEIDLNAGKLLPNQGVTGLLPGKPALIVRPARNFTEGKRYVVVLRRLVDDAGAPIPAGPAFRACRDLAAGLLPPLMQRCAQLEADVFPVLERAGIPRDDSLYLAWDFTIASPENMVSRLRHMRDDAFQNVLGQTEDAAGNILDLGAAPTFAITQVEENPTDELARRIRGVMTVPSYVIPSDPSPLDAAEEFISLMQAFDDNFPSALGPVREQCSGVDPTGLLCDVFDPAGVLRLAATVSLPPNRLYYDPTDSPSTDPAGALYGDGLPDQNGTLSTQFTCNIPHAALAGKDFASATAADVRPARAGIYGHGLLGGQGEVNQDQLRAFGNEHDIVFCATDWFGFASGDIVNVVSALVDSSFFPVVPDGSQQGVLNQMFLARLLRHPQGFAANENFQVGGVPLIAPTDQVYYDGNSQGGIMGGVVVAASKDIRRGSLGVVGMNYSTLLTRSSDFSLYSVPLYLSYQDDLDRNLVFSLLQMLWDRSENNGYAEHVTDNSAFHGPDKQLLLHPAFGDHQVTMWSADVMARTLGARVDHSRVDPARHPDLEEYVGLVPLDYANPQHRAGSGLVVWDEPWGGARCHDQLTPPPPRGNTPPNDGDDPHECPRRETVGHCQKSNFLSPDGRLVAVPRSDREAVGFVCP